MTDFYDWLTASDSGLSADRLAEQFRLSHQEMRRTSEAVMPAFMLALQKAMLDQDTWRKFSERFAAFTPGNPLFDGEPPKGQAASRLLEGLFGSKALTDAVARQVSMASGIAPDTVRKLMPGLAVMTVNAAAAMMMAGIARNQPEGLMTGDYGGAVAEMMRRSANAVEALNRPSGTGKSGRPFGSDYLEQMFSGALKSGFPWTEGAVARPPYGKSTTGPSGVPANPFLPFADMMEAFSKGMERASPAADAAAAPPPDQSAEADHAPSPDAGLTGMMKTGQRLQEDYVREMMALFERYQPTRPHTKKDG